MKGRVTRQQWYAVWALCASCAAVGCGDDDDTTPTTTGGGGAGGQSVQLQSLEVEVRMETDEGLGPVVEGAQVAFDKPGGGRLEATTGADGRVVFDGIDWSLEPPGALTTYLEGYPLHSFVGLTEETVAWFMARFDTDVLTSVVIEPEADDTVAVSGAATHMLDEENWLLVSTNRYNEMHSDQGAEFSLAVRTGEPFALIGLEYAIVNPPTVSNRGVEGTFEKWAKLDHAAVSEATAGVELDLDAGALSPTTASGSYPIPDHGITPFFDTAQGYLRTTCVSSEGAAMLGLAPHLDASADGSRFEYDAEYVDPGDVTGMFTWLGATSGNRASLVMVPGALEEGEPVGIMPEPPNLFSSVIPMGGTFTWELNDVDRADEELGINAFFRNRYEEREVWYVLAPYGSTSLTLPDLPSGVDADEALGFGVLVGDLALCGAPLAGEYERYCSRFAVNSPIQINR